jgi:hypothetical protein
MTDPVTDAEARLALEEVERGRRRVIDQIGIRGGIGVAWLPAGSPWGC